VTSSQPICDLCGDPTDGYVCRRCSEETAKHLRDVVDLAGEVETNVARLARYATRGGHRAALVDVEERGPGVVNRRQLVEAFGWPASKDRPIRGALRATALPVDLNASARATYAFNDVATWARQVEEERAQPVPVLPGQHPAAAAAAFLLGQLDWIRHQRFADEANEQLRAAGAVVRRIVDAPAEQEIVGLCDCGVHLYAHKGAATVTCQGCRSRWDVRKSRDGLREALREYLVTAAEAANLLAFFGLAGDRARCRKTINMWAVRGRVLAHGEVEGDPAYRFGDILDRAAARAAESEGDAA
jgi:hypothetical protein